MSSTPDLTLIESALQKFCGNYSDTLLYLQPNQEQQNEWKTMIRDIYNHLSLISCHDSSLKQKILIPELLVDNFDEEQIWQQVELLNEVLVNNVQAEIDKKLSEKTPSPEKNNDNELDDIEEEEEQEEHELEESAEEDINEEDIPANKPKFDLADMDKFCEEVEKEPEEGAEGSEEEEDAPDIFGDLGEDEDNEDDDVQESKLEQQLKKVQAKIHANEEHSMQPKSWKMLGESSTRNREDNALLEEHLQFDHGVRPAPEITMDTTNKIERLIIERIKVKLFDDVERKEKPTGRDIMKQKELPLNQEKSQLSLAEVYEKEYVEAQEVADGVEKEEVDENEESIKRDLANLFRKLDALSNFVYTPKGIKDELKIIVNAPAITVEEAMPTAVADTQLLAPAEVKAKQKEELRTSIEETETDKKRKRRKIKKSQSIKANERELKKMKRERDSDGKKIRTKKDAISAVADEVKQGITLAKKSSSGKVSSNFFSKLQDSINEEGSGKHKKKVKTGKVKKFNKFG